MTQPSAINIGFECTAENCGSTVRIDLANPASSVSCPKCGKSYPFDAAVTDKLTKLANLIVAVNDAQGILGDCDVAVAVPGGEAKVPYALLLSRLNASITLPLDGARTTLPVWIERGR